jgi:type VI secretion system ImpM family protein
MRRMTNPATHAPVPKAVAWYGKLPSRGDFISRGMPRSWSRAWDEWLQRGLMHAAQRVGAAGLRERLQAMPPWACAFGPVQPGEPMWLGAVVSSSDRVGRIFPTLLVEAYDAGMLCGASVPALLDRAGEFADWLIEVNRESVSLKEFERGAAELSSMPWDVSVLDNGDHAFDRVRAQWPMARSFWWRMDDSVELPAALAEDWPPRDDLLLDWIGAAGGVEPAPPDEPAQPA